MHNHWKTTKIIGEKKNAEAEKKRKRLFVICQTHYLISVFFWDRKQMVWLAYAVEKNVLYLFWKWFYSKHFDCAFIYGKCFDICQMILVDLIRFRLWCFLIYWINFESMTWSHLTWLFKCGQPSFSRNEWIFVIVGAHTFRWKWHEQLNRLFRLLSIYYEVARSHLIDFPWIFAQFNG